MSRGIFNLGRNRHSDKMTIIREEDKSQLKLGSKAFHSLGRNFPF